MTPRYRCPWCASFTHHSSKEVRKHILKVHRTVLIKGLGLIESFTTRNPSDPRIIDLNRSPRLNPGVSGEGDS